MSEATAVEAPRCPKCRLPLQPLKSVGVTLDACVECKGLWFDGGEVERVIGVDTAGPFREQLAGPGSQVTGASCPRGHGAVREVALELDEHKTVVSGCLQCGGVWIDRGDLVQIRPHLPQPAVASDERIEGLELQVGEVQREADDRRIDALERGVESMGEYLGLYLLGGVVASLAHIASDPASTMPLVGASGAISAVMGAYVYLFPQRRIYTKAYPRDLVPGGLAGAADLLCLDRRPRGGVVGPSAGSSSAWGWRPFTDR